LPLPLRVTVPGTLVPMALVAVTEKV